VRGEQLAQLTLGHEGGDVLLLVADATVVPVSDSGRWFDQNVTNDLKIIVYRAEAHNFVSFICKCCYSVNCYKIR